MKKTRAALLSMLILSLSVSCLRVDDPEPEDPNAQMEDLLRGAQYYFAEWLSGDFARYQLMWAQQLSGVRGPHLQMEVYNAQPANFDNMWREYYMELMQRLFLLDFIAGQHDAPVYYGISHILKAFALGMAADAWGDMPYSETGKYYSVEQNPKYDTQEELYVAINELLDEGVILLETSGGMQPAGLNRDVDFFFEGDLSRWVKTARLLKLKFSLRLSHLSGDYARSLLLIEQGGMLSGQSDDMAFPYVLLNGFNNPWFHFDFHVGNIRVGSRIADMLLDTNDPRLTRYLRMNTNNEYVGASPGSMNLNASRFANNTSGIGHADRRLVLLSYAEQKFIEAEVYYRQGMQSQSDEAYFQGVIASLGMYNARSEGWEYEYAQQENVDLEQIMTAKYLALFLNPEVWTDWRRTGYPQLNDVVGNVNDDLTPRRFIYPSTEEIQNSTNMPADVTINSRVWWDE